MTLSVIMANNHREELPAYRDINIPYYEQMGQSVGKVLGYHHTGIHSGLTIPHMAVTETVFECILIINGIDTRTVLTVD